MVLSEKEVKNFVEVFKKKAQGKISSTIVKKMVDAALSTRSRDDNDILRSMIVVAKQSGASKDAVTTALAQAVDERERVINNEEVKEYVAPPSLQVLYGPGPIEKPIPVPEPIEYRETVNVPQVLYGPGPVPVEVKPASEIREMVIDSMQCLYGPGPVPVEVKPSKGIKR